jgi:hypothetical protein
MLWPIKHSRQNQRLTRSCGPIRARSLDGGLAPKRPRTMTHDYTRHGVVTPFAALNALEQDAINLHRILLKFFAQFPRIRAAYLAHMSKCLPDFDRQKKQPSKCLPDFDKQRKRPSKCLPDFDRQRKQPSKCLPDFDQRISERYLSGCDQTSTAPSATGCHADIRCFWQVFQINRPGL